MGPITMKTGDWAIGKNTLIKINNVNLSLNKVLIIMTIKIVE